MSQPLNFERSFIIINTNILVEMPENYEIDLELTPDPPPPHTHTLCQIKFRIEFQKDLKIFPKISSHIR